jgi:hypothetical protein
MKLKEADEIAGLSDEERMKQGKTLMSPEDRDRWEDLLEEGQKAEEIICSYVDKLVTANNPRSAADRPQDGVPDPHPCSLDWRGITDRHDDYVQLANCCQKHVCRLDGYCSSKKRKTETGAVSSCRFGYPFELVPKTRLVYRRIDKDSDRVAVTIDLQRNDSCMNIHNRTMLENWRANVDMQIIIDHHAAVQYMVKYASKGEKTSVDAYKLFKSIITLGPNLTLRNCLFTKEDYMTLMKRSTRNLGDRYA